MKVIIKPGHPLCDYAVEDYYHQHKDDDEIVTSSSLLYYRLCVGHIQKEIQQLDVEVYDVYGEKMVASGSVNQRMFYLLGASTDENSTEPDTVLSQILHSIDVIDTHLYDNMGV